MKVLLIDADSKIPNLALMKLAQFYYKNYWAEITLKQMGIPYYPDQIKYEHIIDTSGYDLIFCSVVFEGNEEFIKGDNIIFGGPGMKDINYLPKEVDECEPNYNIYSKDFVDDTSYGFISRGCIRKCSFCKVHKLEGYILRYRNVDDIVKHSKVKFMDNNILALPEHKEVLQELIDKKIKCQFNQGLDIRLIDKENSLLLSKLKYWKEYIFAFDNINLQSLIEEKLILLNWRKEWNFKFFVYVHPDMNLHETIYRIEWLKERKCLPYIMRHVDCWGSDNNSFYVDLAAWCNQPFAFKKLNFEQFLVRRHNNKERIKNSLKLWNENC